LNTKDESHFSGIGPELGLDFSYQMFYGISAVGHFDSALLVGKIHSTLNVANIETNASTGALIEQVYASIDNPSTRRVVPAMDAKLGLNYVYAFSDKCDVMVEAGWLFSEYFNAVDVLAAEAFFTSGEITGHKSTDASLQGPYFSIAVSL
jgi:hypothetical protein